MQRELHRRAVACWHLSQLLPFWLRLVVHSFGRAISLSSASLLGFAHRSLRRYFMLWLLANLRRDHMAGRRSELSHRFAVVLMHRCLVRDFQVWRRSLRSQLCVSHSPAALFKDNEVERRFQKWWEIFVDGLRVRLLVSSFFARRSARQLNRAWHAWRKVLVPVHKTTPAVEAVDSRQQRLAMHRTMQFWALQCVDKRQRMAMVSGHRIQQLQR